MATKGRSHEGSPAAAESAAPASERPTTKTIALTMRSPESDDPGRSAPFWSPLAAVRAAIDEMFADLDAETVDAIRMAGGELAENVIKYGEPVDDVTGHITFSRTDSAVEIRTVNRLTDATRMAELFDRLRRIDESEDLRGQFVDRMTEIIDDPEQHSTALGLLRVGYEGLFKLSGSHASGTLTIVAVRSAG